MPRKLDYGAYFVIVKHARLLAGFVLCADKAGNMVLMSVGCYNVIELAVLAIFVYVRPYRRRAVLA